jgi:hypothetical protein
MGSPRGTPASAATEPAINNARLLGHAGTLACAFIQYSRHYTVID